MDKSNQLAQLQRELHEELTGNILPYWMNNTLDDSFGGFVGQIDQENRVIPNAAKGAILNARILWTFSAAYRILKTPAYGLIADRAFDYVCNRFRDQRNDGFFWSLDHTGQPLDTRKHIYAQAFMLYGLVEYFRATGHPEALDLAIKTFHLIERYAFDPDQEGYFEAFTREWKPMNDVRLSDKDLNVPKSMNTHLHVLEAYTNLLRVWPEPYLQTKLASLIDLFLDIIIDETTGHMRTFFSVDWKSEKEGYSYGHDIEGSWLLYEAARVVSDPAQLERVRLAALKTARVTMEEGQDTDGGLFYEILPDGSLNSDKHWWPQAEAVVGFLNAYDLSGDSGYIDAALATWAYTRTHVVDTRHGEWFGCLARDGRVYPGEDKAGFWKCPYHNGRLCLEVITRPGNGSAGINPDGDTLSRIAG